MRQNDHKPRTYGRHGSRAAFILCKVFYFLSAAAACISSGYLFSIVLAGNEQMPGRQNILFVYGVSAAAVSAVFTSVFALKKIRFGWTDCFALILFGYLTFNYYFISGVNASGRYLDLLYLTILYISLRVFFASYPLYKYFCFTAILVFGWYGAYEGLLQALGRAASRHGLFGVTGRFFNPGPYGGYLAVIMALSLGYLVRYYRVAVNLFAKIKKRPAVILKEPAIVIYSLCLVCFLSCFLIFFAVMSRAAIVALFITGTVIIISEKYLRVRIRGIYGRLTKKAIVICCIGVFAVVGTGGILYHLKKESADGRLLLWRSSLSILADHPLFGVGYGAWGGAYSEAQAHYLMHRDDPAGITSADAPEYAFNEYLLIGAETGLPGLILLLLLLGGAVISDIRRNGLFWPGLLALSFFAFFSYPFSILYLSLLSVFFLSGSGCGTGASEPKPEKSSLDGKLFAAFLFSVLSLLAVFNAAVYAKKVDAVQQWSMLKTLDDNYFGEVKMSDYARLYPYLCDNFRFLFDYGRTLNRNGRFDESIEILRQGSALSPDPMFRNIMGNNYMALGRYETALDLYREAYRIVPNRLYPLYLQMKLYVEINDKESALMMCDSIIGFRPKIESSATRDIKNEAMQIKSTLSDT